MVLPPVTTSPLCMWTCVQSPLGRPLAAAPLSVASQFLRSLPQPPLLISSCFLGIKVSPMNSGLAGDLEFFLGSP